MGDSLREDILRECEGLSLGESLRITHRGCNSSDRKKAVIVTRRDDGFLYYCHKCDDRGIVRDRARYFKDSKESTTTHAKSKLSDVRPPSDPSRRIPCSKASARIRGWVEQYIALTEADDHGLFVVDNTLWLPTSGDGFQYRVFDANWKGPKYVYVGSANNRFFNACSPHGSSVLVVTEDILSAIVVSRHCDATAVLGTSVHPEVLSVLGRKRYDRCFVFFDDDNSVVQKNQRRAKRTLELICRDVRIIHSKGRDPKEHSKKELEELFK